MYNNIPNLYSACCDSIKYKDTNFKKERSVYVSDDGKDFLYIRWES